MKQLFGLFCRKRPLILLSAFLVIGWSHKIAVAHNRNVLYLAQSPSPTDTSNPLDSQLDNVPPFRDITPTETLPTRTLPPVDNLLDAPSNIPDADPSGDETPILQVKQFDIQGNTVFEDAEIQALLTDYINTPLSFPDLLQLETIITKLYTDNGYINSGAVIPAQNVSDGVITIQVIEGRIATEDIEIKVNGRLSENYILARLKRGTKTPLNIEQLQEALQLLQLDPLIENLNAELSVGSSRDRWKLRVEVNQAQAFRPVIFGNNSRPPSVGSFQRGIEINHNNLLGFGDRASFIYKNTDGSNDFDTNYTIPFNALDGTIRLRYRYIASDIVESPFDRIDIESKTDKYEINLRQPILVRATPDSTQELAVGIELSRQANETTVENQPVQLSPGSDVNGKTKISAIRLFQDWTRRSRRQVFAMRSQFSVGLDALDSTINEDEPDSRFFTWRGQAQWLRQINSNSNINLLLRSDIQLSTTALVPLEQFSLGGINTVRGYRQDVLLGDNGILLSGEVRIPVYRWSERQNNIFLIPFIDFGTVWSQNRLVNQEEDTLFSVGLGVQLTISDHLRARVDWGIPLIEVRDTNRTLQENGIYFSLEYLPL